MFWPFLTSLLFLFVSQNTKLHFTGIKSSNVNSFGLFTIRLCKVLNQLHKGIRIHIYLSAPCNHNRSTWIMGLNLQHNFCSNSVDKEGAGWRREQIESCLVTGWGSILKLHTQAMGKKGNVELCSWSTMPSGVMQWAANIKPKYPAQPG